MAAIAKEHGCVVAIWIDDITISDQAFNATRIGSRLDANKSLMGGLAGMNGQLSQIAAGNS